MFPIERRDECDAIYAKGSFPSLSLLEGAVSNAFPNSKAEDVLVFAVPMILQEGMVHACRRDRFDAHALSAETAKITTLAELQEEARGRDHELLIVASEQIDWTGESYRIVLQELASPPRITELIGIGLNRLRLADAA